MKHLLKKKSLLSIILILILMFTLCACSGSSPLAKDEDILVGHWESELKDLEDGTPLFSMTFNKDGTGVFDFMIEVNITDYSCEDGTLHMDFDNGNTLSFKYRFNDDKSAVYLYDDEYPDEYKFNRLDKDNASTESNTEKSDSEKTSNNDTKDTETQNDNSDSESYNNYDSEYEDAQSEVNLLGTWESEEVLDDGLPAYSLVFNSDGSCSFTDPDYVYELQGYYVEDTVLYLVDTDGGMLDVCFGFDTFYTNLYIEYTNVDGKTVSADLFRQ